MNTVYIAGNLTRDPEVRYFDDGKAVSNFTVALNERSKDGKETTSFIRCAAWGDVALRSAELMRTGTRVIIEGRLNQKTWTDKDGKKHDEVSVIARSVDVVIKPVQPTVARDVEQVPADLPF